MATVKSQRQLQPVGALPDGTLLIERTPIMATLTSSLGLVRPPERRLPTDKGNRVEMGCNHAKTIGSVSPAETFPLARKSLRHRRMRHKQALSLTVWHEVNPQN